jgi:hypothetical protein
VVKPHPPLHRAMLLTKQALEAAGHKGTSPTLLSIEYSLINLIRCSHRLGAAPPSRNLQKRGSFDGTDSAFD